MLILLIIIILPFFFTPFKIGSPFFIIGLFLFVFFILKYYLFQNLGSSFLYSLTFQVINEQMKYMLFYILFSYLIAFIYILYKRGKKIDKKYSTYKVKASAYYLTIILPLLLIFLAVSKGINPLTQPLQMRQFSESNGMFYILAPILFLIYLTIIQLIKSISKRKIPEFKICLASAVSISYALVSGFGSTIIICFGLYLIYLSTLKRIKIEKLLLVLFPILMIYAVIQNQYRIIKIDTSNKVELIELISKIEVDDILIEAMFNRFDYLEMYCSGHEYLLRNEPDYGKSLFSSVVQVIPRSVWPEKPYNTSSYMSRKIIPDVVEKVGSTANFNSLNEFTRSFGGTIGLIFGCLIFGMILGRVYFEYESSLNLEYYSLKYAMVIFLFCFIGFVAGFINDQAPQVLLINYILFKVFIKGEKTEKLNR